MKIHNFEQGTPEWFKVRELKLTASHATAIANCGKGLDTYVVKLISEYYSSAEKTNIETKDTERGNEYEPVARSVYEFENNVTVEQVGFIEHNEFVGCSPDGLVGEDGGLEIKCVNDENYVYYLLDGEKEIKSDYIWQIQMNLLITGRKWWDLVIYNPNFKNSMLTFRIFPVEEKFEKLREGFKLGVEKIKIIKDKIEKNTNVK